MAQLGKPYPFPKREDYKDWKDFHKASDEAFDKIPSEKRVGFPVADGYANYYVQSIRPLILRHIDYMDGYCIPYAYVRGLRAEDVEALIRWQSKIDAVFGTE